MRIFILLVAAVMLGDVNGRVEFNATRLKTGSFRYRTLVNGKDAGKSEISVGMSGDQYVFSNSVTGEFSQRWEAVAKANFAPVSAKLVFGEGVVVRSAFDLMYAGRRVKGSAKGRTVDQEVAEDTVDQRIDWAAVMSLPDYRRDKEYTFHVYDPGTGNSLVRVKVGATHNLRVPAGTFEAQSVSYSIDKAHGPETYKLFMRSSIPRFMIREDFPNGATTELLETTP